MHEIITLQLGQQANYVGTHFWNAQEAYFTYDEEATSNAIDHNVLFRPGLGAGGTDTFTPRALIYDLKGGYGAMKKINALYEEVENDNSLSKQLWDHCTVTQRQAPIEQVPYQKDLEAGVTPPTPLTEADVRYWSDFNRVYFHPRSSVQLSEYELDSKIQPFERYELGSELYQQLNRDHDLIDRDFRLFAEECDQMQGVQVFTTADDGWAGFAGRYLEELRDEYGKASIWTFGLESGERVSRGKKITRTVSLAMSLSQIAAFSSTYIPLRIPSKFPNYISMNRSSRWHTSALLSSAIETCTLPTRLLQTGSNLNSLDNLSDFLNTTGNRKISLLSMSVIGGEKASENASACGLPIFKAAPMKNRINCSWEEEDGPSQRKKRRKNRVYVEASVARGFGERAYDEPEQRGSEDQHEPIFSRIATPLTYPVVDSFPDIFPTLGEHLAIEAVLTTTAAVIDRVKDIRDLAAWGVKVDEREALTNELDGIVDGFLEGWNSDSESDGD